MFVPGIVGRTVATLNVIVFGSTAAAGSGTQQGARLGHRHPTQRSFNGKGTNLVIVIGRIAVTRVTDAVAVVPVASHIVVANDGHHRHNVRVDRLTSAHHNGGQEKEEGN